MFEAILAYNTVWWYCILGMVDEQRQPNKYDFGPPKKNTVGFIMYGIGKHMLSMPC